MTDNARLCYSSGTLIVLFMLHKCYWILINIFFNLTKVWLNNLHVSLRLSEGRFVFVLPCP